ncbi:LysM peptidoglycan-binding domain-containing protein [Panacagrimonas sp.]|uniref:LysM peptidoglycan-binding domain-containing protein n=1 Tax=Panacagrimonas sp. TaxID=2480088 RepID=UPI003B51ED5E
MQAGESQARGRAAQATALVQQTQVLVPSWTAADLTLSTAHAALLAQDWSLARRKADEAAALAEQTLSDFYARQANAELQRAQQYTGLDDAQLLQLRTAEEIMATGNSRLAYGQLRQLNWQLDKRIKTYAVRSGDSLWVIAAQPEHYANPWLWPLIWRANLSVLPDPDRLRSGQVLRVRPHPKVDEVVQALSYSRREAGIEAGVTPEIGEIREAPGP